MLSQSLRRDFDPSSGADPSNVRIHGDSDTDETPPPRANAPTTSDELTSATPRVRRNDFTGRRLLAHELTQVLGQSATTVDHELPPEVHIMRGPTMRGFEPRVEEIAKLDSKPTRRTVNVLVCSRNDDIKQIQKQCARNPSSLIVVRVNDLRDLTRRLHKLKKQRRSEIGVLYFVSRGSYETPSFFIGPRRDRRGTTSKKNRIDPKSLDRKRTKRRLRRLKKLMDPGTQLVLMSCHTGGGANPKRAAKFIQKAADRFGATVYAHMSWGAASADLFRGRLCVSRLRSAYEKNAAKVFRKKTNAFKFLGLMLEAKPKKKKPKRVNPLVVQRDGSIRVASIDFNAQTKPIVRRLRKFVEGRGRAVRRKDLRVIRALHLSPSGETTG